MKLKMLSILFILFALSGYGQPDSTHIEQEELPQDSINILMPEIDTQTETMLETLSQTLESNTVTVLSPQTPGVIIFSCYSNYPVSYFAGLNGKENCLIH